MKKLLSAAAVLGLITLYGCENAVDAPGIDAWRNPEAGSILIFRNSMGQNIDGDTSHSVSSVSIEILETGRELWGKSNVSIAIGPEGDTIAFLVDQNGDFQMAERGPDSWEVFPTGSKGTVTVRDLDTTINGDEREIWKTTRAYAGDDYISFDDKEFHAIKIVQNESHRETSPFWNYLSTSTDTLHFSPDLGFLIRQRSLAQTFADDTLWSTHSRSMDLNGYILK
ncbi:MAG TPA: hypothetical protein VFH43_00660 [Candidatus Kapabacteria bacterium]|jgi:hypothetical protein|nr:hypothetical protein [Candidatus Kapabacteria bacterium]